MDHSEVEIHQVKEPMGLSAVQCLGFVEVRQVFVIGEDLDGEGGTMEVMSPGFEGTDDSQEFSVVNIIVPFCWGEGLREVGTGMPFAIRVSLEKDGA